MHEILFRGKRFDNSRWVYGYLSFIYVDGKNQDGFIYTNKAQIYSQEDCRSYDVLTETVGQFTGLTDKNGTKIFEHDIIKFCDDDGEKSYYKIEWNSYKWIAIDEDGNVDDLDKFLCDMSAVAGNIFDNPELLGGES